MVKRGYSPPSVIPALAGTHARQYIPLDAPRSWVPAFAGMTVGVALAIPRTAIAVCGEA